MQRFRRVKTRPPIRRDAHWTDVSYLAAATRQRSSTQEQPSPSGRSHSCRRGILQQSTRRPGGPASALPHKEHGWETYIGSTNLSRSLSRPARTPGITAGWTLIRVQSARFDLCDSGGSISDIRVLTAEDARSRIRATIPQIRLNRSMPRTIFRSFGTAKADGSLRLRSRTAPLELPPEWPATFDVFDRPLEKETQYFLDALLPGGSTKGASASGQRSGL